MHGTNAQAGYYLLYIIYREMDQLPELAKVAISTACSSGKSFSWKFQENSGRIVIQLMWKADPECVDSVSGKTTRVCSSKNHPSEPLSERKRRKRISPSRAHRNARRLQAFLDRKKRSLMPVDDQKDSELVIYVENKVPLGPIWRF